MKSLCLDARLLSAPGIGTYLKNLVVHIRNWPFSISALVHLSDFKEFDLGERIKPIFVKSPIYSISEQWELPLKIPSVDIFWSPHYNIPILPIRAKKMLATIHDVYHLAFIERLQLKERMYAKWMFKQTVKRSEKVITVSRFSKTEILKYIEIDPGKIHDIHHGIDHNVFHPNNADALKAINNKFNLKQPFILSVGGSKPHKNANGILDAFQLLKHKGYENLNLVFVGKMNALKRGENLRERVSNMPSIREKVHFLGYVEDVDLVKLYQCAEMLAFPSFYEGFGIPPLEAMSCGCPVVTSNTASLPEICGNAALYVDPSSFEDIANAMQKFLDDVDLRRSYVEKGIEMSKSFIWKDCADAHLAIVERMLTC